MPARGLRTSRCKVCAHPDRGRIDYLLVANAGEIGGGRQSLSAKFGVSESSLYAHRKNHISEEYRRAVKIGPLESEEHLRKLVAETGSSVLERFQALYNGHLARWMVAFEAGNDGSMVHHGHLMSALLQKVALITREVMPTGSTVTNNVFLSPDYAAFQQRAIKVLRRHPDVLAEWLAEFRASSGNEAYDTNSPRNRLMIEAMAND
jgi:hypothetical protein